VLLMAAVGFAASVFLAKPDEGDDGYQPRRAKQVAPPDETAAPEEEDVRLDDVLQRQGGN
jgi:hypothetical protein